jgi:hypothetical protein
VLQERQQAKELIMIRENRRNVMLATLVCALLASSAWLRGDDDGLFSDWSAPVSIGSIVNTLANEGGEVVSKDGLSLFFVSNRTGSLGGGDIWVSQRAAANAPWGPAQNLGTTINSVSNEQTVALSLDEHLLFFTSNRPGGFGGFDLYVSRRHNKRDDFGWQTPVNLGSGVNSAGGEFGPTFFEDDDTGAIILYFSSDRLVVSGFDIYASTLQPDETFGPAVLVEELNSPSNDIRPWIRRDGLEMFLDSDRIGTLGALDLWASTRASTADAWSVPVNLGPLVNGPADDFRPALSFEGTVLYFSSNRPGFGGLDIYASTRSKLRSPDCDNRGRKHDGHDHRSGCGDD